MGKLKNTIEHIKEVKGAVQEKYLEVQGLSSEFEKEFEEAFKIKPQEQITAFQAVELYMTMSDLALSDSDVACR